MFRVDLIDPCAVTVTALGYANGLTRQSGARTTPGIIRLVKSSRAEPWAEDGDVLELGRRYP